MTDQVKARITPDDLMGDAWVEVVNGELVEVDTNMMGFLHTIVIHSLYDKLKPFVKLHKLGYVHGDGLKYILHVDEDGVQTSRTPDLAFLRKGRIPHADDERPYSGAPDFAVEVASPGQTPADMLEKVADFLRYGTEEVWLIYPMQRTIYRYRRTEAAPEVFHDTDSIESAFFPGLSITVADLFVMEDN